MFGLHTEAPKLVCSATDPFKSFVERVRVVLFGREEWAEYAIKEASSCMLGMKDAD